MKLEYKILGNPALLGNLVFSFIVKTHLTKQTNRDALSKHLFLVKCFEKYGHPW